ncbi:MAG: tetratricopeptide repeat protein [Armatimonadetes bacterium]|nr:tetratricopeptide repeat protein [Armatimonadota bacterium]
MKRPVPCWIPLLLLLPILGAASCSPRTEGSIPLPGTSPSAASGAAVAQEPVPAEIPWRTSYSEAEAEAKKSGKPILVTLHTDWCGYCRKMEGEVFPDERVRRAAAPYVPVRLDGEKEGQPLVRKFGVTGFPAHMVLTPEGFIALMIPGYLPAESFVTTLNEGIGRYEQGLQLEQQYRQNPSDLENATKLGQLHADRGNVQGAEEIRAVLEKADPQNNRNWKAPLYNQLAASYLTRNEFDAALPLLKEAVKIATDTPDVVQSHLNLAMCYGMRNRSAEGIPLVERVLGLPDAPEERRGQAERLLTMLRQDSTKKK